MISTKVLAGILRACADAIENNGYQGEQNLSAARLLYGIPKQLDTASKAVHAHYQALTKDPAPSTAGQEKELTPETIEEQARATAAALGVPFTTCRYGTWGDGTKGNAWASTIAPYDERHAARLTNYHRMRAIEKGLEDAVEDDKVLEALEAVLNK